MQHSFFKTLAFSISLFLLANTLFAQSNDGEVYNVVNVNDSVVLRLNDYVGDIQWQTFNENDGWENLIGEVYDTLLFVADVSTLFRAEVIAGHCDPFYSDTVYVEVRAACPGYPTVADFDGNVYQTIFLNGQCWFVQNLRASHYANGDPIEHLQTNSEWSNSHSGQTGGWCWYNNDSTNEHAFGKLYNWYAVNDERNICPPGWHVPSSDEWEGLISYLGGSSVAGGKLKSTGTIESQDGFWHYPNTGASNVAGFFGHPGGHRLFSGTFQSIGYSGDWWTSTQSTTNYSTIRFLLYDNSSVGIYNLASWREGFSVRCIKIIE